ncbi:hypothetical protein C3747_102g57 [Trypanosoma cruzi]|uniref:Uncharacterized protein n=1 Tax=Trypanosoma cruzi TaxID=5693 RepID=A0A2V2WGD5_TRYCR|nr:hypothetical protein C3747_102g57 [Trypanosoma cruzi]
MHAARSLNVSNNFFALLRGVVLPENLKPADDDGGDGRHRGLRSLLRLKAKENRTKEIQQHSTKRERRLRETMNRQSQGSTTSGGKRLDPYLLLRRQMYFCPFQRCRKWNTVACLSVLCGRWRCSTLSTRMPKSLHQILTSHPPLHAFQGCRVYILWQAIDGRKMMLPLCLWRSMRRLSPLLRRRPLCTWKWQSLPSNR